MTEEEARARIAADVSRETLARLDAFYGLLLKWQQKINLVAPDTVRSVWSRHFLDSHQLLALTPANDGLWVDLGSGGGFPGLYCAIVARERFPAMTFELIESDTRKCAFLREVARQTDTPLTITNRRAEVVEPREAAIVSARALAPLSSLLPLVHRHLAPSGIALLQKGANHAEELETARRDWQMDVETRPSVTAPQSVVLLVRNLAHA